MFDDPELCNEVLLVCGTGLLAGLCCVLTWDLDKAGMSGLLVAACLTLACGAVLLGLLARRRPGKRSLSR